MKTTKENRECFVEESIPIFKQHTQYWKVKYVRDICDDLDTLEARLEEYRKLLERAERFLVQIGHPLTGGCMSGHYPKDPCDCGYKLWLSDYNALLEKKDE